tara:strand:- start:1041 stop:1937 length:897 start_codon:yes stop_codon:yes gene_type:complete
MNLSDHFVTCIKRWYGKEGENWLKNLQNHIDACAKKWDLDIGEPMSNLSVNYVTAAKLSDGTEVILKMSPHKKPIMEMEALEHLTNHPGIINLIYSDEDLAAMVIEKVSPGTSLRVIQAKDDEEAMRIAAPIIKDVQADVPSGHHLRTVRKEMEVIKEMHDRGGWDMETMNMLSTALTLQNQLEASKKEDKLIHGDLHHDNILLDEKRGWLAIDPKGRIGDPAYNAARIMRNYWDTEPTEEIVQTRLKILAEVIGFDEWRIAAWSYMDCVLSESWDLDEIGKRGEDEKPIIEILEALL